MRRPLLPLLALLVVVVSWFVSPNSAQAQSAVDGFSPAPNGSVLAMVEQPDGRLLVGGDFTTLFSGSVSRARLALLNHDGTIDSTFDPGVNGTVSGLAVQPDGRILVGGTFTLIGGGGTGNTARSNIARLNADGTVDSTFNPGANGSVSVFAVQGDGRILVGGGFTALGGGGSGTTTRNRIGRLEATGDLDATFDPGATSFVNAMAIAPDGQILVAGAFTGLGGGTGTTTRNRIGRLTADGTVDAGFDPGANQAVYALALQPDGKVIVGGLFSGLGGGTGTTARPGLGRIDANGALDLAFVPPLNSTKIVQAVALQPDGRIVIGGPFTSPTASSTHIYFLRLMSDGTLDDAFNPAVSTQVQRLLVQRDGSILTGGFSNVFVRWYPSGAKDSTFDPGTNNRVLSMATQPDGKVIVGGDFSLIGGGGTGITGRALLARLNPDGTVDPVFNPGADGSVFALAVQPDGKILVGGQFGTLAGATRPRLGRLNPDGSLDGSFTPNALGLVDAMVVQPDDRIVIATSVSEGGITRNRVSRLNADGSLDLSFDQGASCCGGIIYTLALQADGKILVGGYFTQMWGPGGAVTRNYLARLNSDGSLDVDFDPGASSSVIAIAVQPDGKIVLAGAFTRLGGGGTGSTARSYIGRLNADGTVDAGFNPGANGGINAILPQHDGKLLVAGSFTTIGGGLTGSTARNRIARLNADGSVDPSFNPGASVNGVRSVAIQPDGKVLVAGEFTTLGGGGSGIASRSRLGRLASSGSVVGDLRVTHTGASVVWQVGDAAPNFSRVTIESSLDGTSFTALGTATRATSSWSLSGLSLPTNQNVFVRARGYYSTGASSASWSMIEAVRMAYIGSSYAAPAFTTEPVSQAIVVGASTTFTVAASGLPLPAYHWQRSADSGVNWEDVQDAAPYSGAWTPTLTLSGASPALNALRYRAVVTNSEGTAISAVATLTVTAAPLTELVTNGTFASGTSGWSLYATPDLSYIQAQVTNGVVEFYRVAPPPGTSNQATIFRTTGVAVASGAPLVATFDLGNSSSVRKRVSVLVLDSNFSDLSVCTFWLPPNTALATYAMRTHTTKAWANAAIYFYAATAGSDGGHYLLDNVSLQYDPDASAQQTECTDPNAPASGAGSDGPTLLTNGDFASGALAPGWGTFGTITAQVTNGVAEFIRPSNVAPVGVLLQATAQAMTPNQVLTASFQLGNSSSVRKRVTAILHDNNFSDLSACTFWLAPNTPLANYALRTYTTQAWTNATLSFYPATTGIEQWIQLDNVSLQRTPGAAIAGTDCQEPGVAPRPASAPAARIGAGAQRDGPAEAGHDDTQRLAERDERRLSAFTVEQGDASAIRGGVVLVSSGDDAFLRLREAIDLRDADAASLAFLSRLDAAASSGAVQVRAGDGAWVTVAGVSPGPLEWHRVDLAAFVGEVVEVRFVFLAVAGEPADTWELSDVRVVR